MKFVYSEFVVFMFEIVGVEIFYSFNVIFKDIVIDELCFVYFFIYEMVWWLGIDSFVEFFV